MAGSVMLGSKEQRHKGLGPRKGGHWLGWNCMSPRFRRSLLVLVALGALVFAPASEEVSRYHTASEPDLSALVLLPTVESAIGAGAYDRTAVATVLEDPRAIAGVLLAGAVLLLFVVQASRLSAPILLLARVRRDRAPPSQP